MPNIENSQLYLLLSSLISLEDLYDSWSCHHGTERDYSFYLTIQKSYSRIDLFLTSKALLQKNLLNYVLKLSRGETTTLYPLLFLPPLPLLDTPHGILMLHCLVLQKHWYRSSLRSLQQTITSFSRINTHETLNIKIPPKTSQRNSNLRNELSSYLQKVHDFYLRSL